eukprot:TRINITY_DN460_c0_g1_i20.p3 TRINITY_DN460_c0_g1~~TRINITY_DN460_c0_g1_i20.p3  ORF type:complete len:112 (+),score=23.15 TRINITY_DN460_c0_g1_i20:500-835(+)
MRTPVITAAPDMPPSVEGMVSLRGALVPVIDLAKEKEREQIKGYQNSVKITKGSKKKEKQKKRKEQKSQKQNRRKKERSKKKMVIIRNQKNKFKTEEQEIWRIIRKNHVKE